VSHNTTRDITAFLRQRVVPPGGSRHGLVVGIEQYRDARLNLRCAGADAKAIFDLMTDPDCGMFPKDNVRLLLNEQATREAIWRALSALRRSAGENDTVWVYYAGHAAPEESNIYWVTHDADVDDLYGTGLSNDQISKVLADIRAKRLLVLLDCCHAAATAAQKNPTRSVLTADEVFSCYKGHGRITLASSDGQEKSVELGDVGHGAFTYFLEQGLRGKADADGDGVVTADELWRYLRAKVVDASQKAGNAQTPVLIGEMRHDFALSLNPLEFGRRQHIAEAIRNLVGVGSDQLTTEEGRTCLELLRRDAHNEAERDLMAEFASLLEGRLRISTLRRLIDDVRETAPSAETASTVTPEIVSPPVDATKTDATATAKADGGCKIKCADDFDQLPAKYQWDRKRTLNVINQWSSKYLGVLSNLADRCEVLDVQAHGYFVWQAKVVVEKRQWTEYRKGINVPNPSGPLEFLKHKPPRVPKLTPEIADALAEICPDCHGTGEYVCPECFGEGQVQCPKCKGVGAYVKFNGSFAHDLKCQLCNGKKSIPCNECNGAPRRLCVSCNGTGITPDAHSPAMHFPQQKTVAALWSVPRNSGADDSWTERSSHIVADQPIALEICAHCKGTGDFVCEDCYGNGVVQCPKCKGTGAYVNFNGSYDYHLKCQLCNGLTTIPCKACKGLPKHRCDVCRGRGMVAVYPAISISCTAIEGSRTSEADTNIGTRYTVPLVIIQGGPEEVPQKAQMLLERFGGTDTLREHLSYSHKDENARIMKVMADVRWYPYMLCRMRHPQTGAEFVIGINCTCGTVFQVQGKCPKGEGFWSWLFGWASRPFDETVEGEPDFMMKQLRSKANEAGAEQREGQLSG